MRTKPSISISKIYYLGGIIVSNLMEKFAVETGPYACCIDTQVLQHLKRIDPTYKWETGMSVNGTVEFLGYQSGELCARVCARVSFS